jgi:probable H4MPT-linked C1 transfer pathway protein
MSAPLAPRRIFGWDIGGSNTKVAFLSDGAVRAVRHQAFEVRHAPGELAAVLRRLADAVAGDAGWDGDAGGSVDRAAAVGAVHAVTMTAELSRHFRMKRDGVAFVIGAVETAFPHDDIRVFAVDGCFLTPQAARLDPLRVSAANWAATARLVARQYPDALLLDIGTTSTDVIPIVRGEVVALGSTDPARLASGELLYTGALRTPVETLAPEVPVSVTLAGVLETRLTGLAAEGFAVSGDVHLWRGDLLPHDYDCATPDGGPVTKAGAGDRLARAVCADREMLDDAAVSAIADALAAAQVERVRAAVMRVAARHAGLRTAVVTGLGSFIAARAAGAAGLQVHQLSADIGAPAARSAPSACVAVLCERALAQEADPDATADSAVPRPSLWPSHRAGKSRPTPLDLVVKLGGGVLAHPGPFTATLEAIGAAADVRRLVVVPGGGPFADVVRALDARLGLDDTAAHWMAVLAMDQYAHLVAARLSRGVVVHEPEAALTAAATGRVPVFAPYQWLRHRDPLPHSWDVTSDSIAAWLAGQLEVARLLLVKPPGAAGANAVDAYFHRALPPSVVAEVVSAGDIPSLRTALAGVAAPAVEPLG